MGNETSIFERLYQIRGLRKKGLSKLNEVKIELTNKCNLDCDFCFNRNKRDVNISMKKIYNIIDEIKGIGVKTIRFTGGEPFLRDDLEQILKYAKKKGLYIILNTNGLLIDDKNIRYLRYVDDILVSLHTLRLFKKKEMILNKLRKFELVIRACTILTKDNIKNLEEYYKFFSKNKIDDWFLLRPVPNYKNRQPIDNKDVKELSEKVIYLNKKYRFNIKIANSVPFCAYDERKLSKICVGGINDMGHNSLVIDCNGNIKASYYSKKILGKLGEDKLIDLWDSKQLKDTRDLKNLHDFCVSCSYVLKCKGALSDEDPDYLIPNPKLTKNSFLNLLKNKIMLLGRISEKELLELIKNYHNNSEFQFQYPQTKDWNDDEFNIFKKWNDKEEINLYLHLPFCLKKCKYCTFPTKVINKKDEIDVYLDYLRKEWILYRKILEKNKVKTIYIGGGTPSCLELEQIRTLFKMLTEKIDLEDVEEVTFESNPESLDKKKIMLLKKNGVTRISLGIQTFNDGDLKYLNRNHTKKQILKIYSLIKKAGLKVNMDILYGLPGQTLKKFSKDIDMLIGLSPDNITYQKLHILSGSGIEKIGYKQDLDVIENMNIYGRKKLLESGYKQYDEEDYAKHEKGFIFQKNHILGGRILGMGISAISFTGKEYYRNTFDYERYYKSVSNSSLPTDKFKVLTKKELIARFTSFNMKSLIIDKKEFKKRFNEDIAKEFPQTIKFLKENFLIKEDTGYITPTEFGKNYIDFVSWMFM